MASKHQSSVVTVKHERSELQEASDELSKHTENVITTWALVQKDLVGNGVVFYQRLVPEMKV